MQQRFGPVVAAYPQQVSRNDSDTDDSDVETAPDGDVQTEPTYFGAPSLPKLVGRLIPSEVRQIIVGRVIPMVIAMVASRACPPLCTSRDLLATFSQVWGYWSREYLFMVNGRVEVGDMIYTLVCSHF